MVPSLAATVRAMFGNPMPQYLNALTIAANQAIADTGATSIFIMEGADVANKCITTSPLTINLPDGKKIHPHMCVISISKAYQRSWSAILSHCYQLRPS
jgi:hypothetical protein